MSTSSKLAQQSVHTTNPTRPTGHGKRFKNGFSQPSDYCSLPSTAMSISYVFTHVSEVPPSPAKVAGENSGNSGKHGKLHTYHKYYPDIRVRSHPDSHIYPLELEGISLNASLLIDAPAKITALKKRMHGRRRSLLRSLLSDRTQTMQSHMALNKLRQVIRMVLPKPRSSLNFADLKDKDGDRMTDQIKVDIEARSTMKNW